MIQNNRKGHKPEPCEVIVSKEADRTVLLSLIEYTSNNE